MLFNPGVKRGNGTVTPNYTSTYVFANDFPALLEDVPTPPESPGKLFEK
jgi:UDPglucose--hexose-1-phosphate uridylyltransferase